MALPMGVQYSVAANAFKTFPNTTGMTASVATAFSAIANVTLLYLSEWGLVNFYLSKEERNGLDSITAKKKLYDFKKNCAFDELDRQFNPLLYFVLGCISGISATERLKFHSLWIAIGIISFLILEIYLARRFRVEVSRNSIDDNDILDDNQLNSLEEIQDEQFSRSLVLQSFDRRMDVQTSYENHSSDKYAQSPAAFRSTSSSMSKSSSPHIRLVHI
jgi:hypothetical protein